MKSCATYDNQGVIIDNCQRVNFFYGANGSGKSTISNYLQNQEDVRYVNCEIEWMGNIPLDVVVYNRDFREKNFKEDIEGVFTLGQATIEEIQALEELKKTRALKNIEYLKQKETLEKKNAEKNTRKERFKENVWISIFKVYENSFKDAFVGLRNNKEKFVEEVLLKYASHKPTELTKEELLKKSEVLYSNKPERCDLFNFQFDSIASAIKDIEQDSIWIKVIAGNQDVPIAKLIHFLDNTDWVNQGRMYIKNGEICPFCQSKTIDDDLQMQLKTFFSGEYEENINRIKSLVSKYEKTFNEILDGLEIVLSKNNLISIGKLNEESLAMHAELLKKMFTSNLSEMCTKEKEAGRKSILQDSDTVISDLKKIIDDADKQIVKHNKIVDNYNEEKKQLTGEIWSFILTESQSIIKAYQEDIDNIDKAIVGLTRGISNCTTQLEELDEKIVEDGKNITSVQPTVDEINRSLVAYGFTNFKIVASTQQPNSYQICREDGTLAVNTLSEGEETFITFLYFMQLAKGATKVSDISKKRILVLDDPICSLDSTVLYIVSCIVKDLLCRVRKDESDVTQAFILTHNVFFHKEASFVDNRTQEINSVNYWIISKDANISRIRAYGVANPIKTSYELLWNELKENTESSKINTQNIMRRIIENYFSMIGKSINEEVVNSFHTTEEQMICRSLVSWINDGSHSINDDLYIDSYSDSVERYKEIFKAIFVNMGHEAHYEMMMA